MNQNDTAAVHAHTIFQCFQNILLTKLRHFDLFFIFLLCWPLKNRLFLIIHFFWLFRQNKWLETVPFKVSLSSALLLDWKKTKRIIKVKNSCQTFVSNYAVEEKDVLTEEADWINFFSFSWKTWKLTFFQS